MKKYPLLYCFFIFLLGITLIDVFNKDKTFSDLENRKLDSKVSFSLKGYFDGSYPKKYESYMSDQFFLRDNWIDLKARSEYVLGKLENNGILYGENQYLFEKVTTINQDRFYKNIASINEFIKGVDSRVSILISPNSYEVYEELLPTGAPLIKQQSYLDILNNSFTNGRNLDLLKILDKNKDKDIFYRTDHHWTTYGAYLAYDAFMNSIGEEAVNLSDLEEVKVKDFYGTFFSKAKPFNVAGDHLTYYNVDNISLEIDGNKFNSLYDYSKLELRDKYAMFLYGNNPLSIIKNSSIGNGKKIVVFKDSYANSLVPFLSLSFEEVHVIDLRTFNNSSIDYVNDNNFDEVMILYNFVNFTRDSNVLKLKK